MALTDEQKSARATRLKNLKTFEPKDEKQYVFISYKSDDWEIVLDDVVRRMVEDYGLRVYFDKNFDRSNESWIDTMQDAINTQKCCAVLAFVSKSYMESYACMLELIQAYSVNFFNREDLSIVPIIIDESNSLGDACSKSSKAAKIEEWGKYDAMLKTAMNSKRIKRDKDLLSCVRSIRSKKNQVNFEQISQLMVRLLSNNTKYRLYRKGVHDDFFENLKATIEKIDNDVFDPDVKNTAKQAEATQRCSDMLVQSTPESIPAVVEIQQATQAESDSAPSEKKKVFTVTGDITYRLYDKEYTENQSDMMLRFFAQVLKRHQNMVDKLPEYRGMNCVSKTNYTDKANVDDSMPSYFRVCQYFEYENGQAICVGTAYAIKDKLKKMALLLDIVGEDPSIFQSAQVELPAIKKAANEADIRSPKAPGGNAKKEAKNFL